MTDGEASGHHGKTMSMSGNMLSNYLEAHQAAAISNFLIAKKESRFRFA